MSQPETTTNEPVYAESDPTVFINRYPTLTELLAKGGKEGIEYLLADTRNLRKLEQDKDEDGEVWWPVPGLPTLSIVGPEGVAESVVLMGRGKPTYGAADYNGRRKYFGDLDVEDATGMPLDPDNPPSKTGNLPTAKIAGEISEKKAKIGASKEG